MKKHIYVHINRPAAALYDKNFQIFTTHFQF